jgi:bla regulator protein BlaR1
MMTRYLASVGPAVANHLWQSTVFAVAVWLLTLLLRRNQARVRYGLWLAASIKFLIPFSLLIELGGVLPKPQHVVAGPQTAVYSAMDTVGQPFSNLDLSTASSTSHAASVLESLAASLPIVLAVVWPCGVVIVLLVWFVRWRQVSATLRRAVPVDKGLEMTILHRLDARARIAVRLSQDLMEPGIFGIFRPVLIWPERLSEQLEEEHIAAIMAHERMHVMRCDNLTAAVHMVVEAAFWFHPMVWWMERRMVEERERACDEAVVQLVGTPEIYAESLLKTCRFCVESPMLCVSGITGADLSRRVRSIMTLRLERLTLGRKLVLTVLGFAAVAGPMAFGVMRMIPMYGQILHATGPRPSFEVASIRPVRPDEQGGNIYGYSGRPDSYSVRGVTIRNLIFYAYGIGFAPEFSGGPKWIGTDKFDIEAKPDDAETAALNKLSRSDRDEQMRLMVQSLLAERFKLKVSFQKRKLPVYALVVAKGGLKCMKSTDASPLATAPRSRFASPPPPPPPPLPGSTPEEARSRDQSPHFTPKGWPFSLLVAFLSNQQEVGGRMVVDKTGLEGTYDCDVSWAREGTDVPGPSFFTAIQEQMGLKLEATKGPVEVLVVDHIDPPSEN